MNRCEFKKPLKEHVPKDNFVWSLNIYACKWDKKCKIDECLYYFTKHAEDYLIVTFEHET